MLPHEEGLVALVGVLLILVEPEGVAIAAGDVGVRATKVNRGKRRLDAGDGLRPREAIGGIVFGQGGQGAIGQIYVGKQHVLAEFRLIPDAVAERQDRVHIGIEQAMIGVVVGAIVPGPGEVGHAVDQELAVDVVRVGGQRIAAGQGNKELAADIDLDGRRPSLQPRRQWLRQVVVMAV